MPAPEEAKTEATDQEKISKTGVKEPEEAKTAAVLADSWVTKVGEEEREEFGGC